MKIATAFSSNSDLKTALNEASEQLQKELGAQPDLALVYFTENYAANELAGLLDNQQATQVHGCSSCLGVMDSNGFHTGEGSAFGIWGAHDPDGAYGSALVEMNNHPRQAGAEAIKQALINAARAGEIPDLVWLSATPGNEESVIQGIQDVVGTDVPIAGGSAADNSVAGNWSIIANNDACTDGVAITVMFPSVKISYAFQSGYSPTHHTGVVTKASGRTIYEIDNKPAAEVYGKWADGVINDSLEGGNVLAQTTFNPLGRKAASVGKIDYYKLSHPDAVTENRALSLFSEFSNGDEITLMSGSRNSLISRAGRVAKSALNVEELDASKISGALVVFCAGCMLTIQDDMEEVVDSINDAFETKPFLGGFTFGEQGCFVEGGNTHGNLMISMVVFDAG